MQSEEEDWNTDSTLSESEMEFDDADRPNTLTVVDRLKINNELLHFASCSYCGQRGLTINERSRNGLGAEWAFTCQDPECTSHKFTKFFHTSSKTSHTYDLNRGLVLGLRLIGRGHSAAERLMSVLNLPRPITKNPWALHTRVLEKAAGELLVQELSNAAKEVREFKFFNGLISTAQRQEDKTINVGVSIDGSWSRGWTARDGVVAVVSIDTGKVLDVVYLSNSCTACQRKEREKNEGTISTIDYLGWYIKHEKDCFLNHEGSAQVSKPCNMLHMFVECAFFYLKVKY
mgnify:FL=1